MSETSNHSPVKIGIVGMPFAAVPYRQNLQSVSAVIHHISRELAGRHQLFIIAGKRGKDPAAEVAGVKYFDIETLGDKLLFPAGGALREFSRSKQRHLMDREIYTPHFANKASRLLANCGCEYVFLMQFPQWLDYFRSRLPQAKIFVWLHSLHNVVEPSATVERLKAADGIVCCSAAVAEQLQHLYPELIGRCQVVANGIDPTVFHPPRFAMKQEPWIFHSGRIVPYKGTHLLVDAFRLIADKHPQLRLKITANFEFRRSSRVRQLASQILGPIIGAPGIDRRNDPVMAIIEQTQRQEISALNRKDYRQELLKRAGKVRDRIDFVGPLSIELLVEYYQRSAVFAHPAIWHEAFGMGVIEAMACGTPVVTTDCGGPAQLVKECHGGLVVDLNAESLAAGLDSILSSSRFSSLGPAGAQAAENHYTWARSATTLARLVGEQRQELA